MWYMNKLNKINFKTTCSSYPLVAWNWHIYLHNQPSEPQNTKLQYGLNSICL